MPAPAAIQIGTDIDWGSIMNQLDRPDRSSVPEPSWWNMVIPIIIIVAGVTLGFLGVM